MKSRALVPMMLCGLLVQPPLSTNKDNYGWRFVAKFNNIYLYSILCILYAISTMNIYMQAHIIGIFNNKHIYDLFIQLQLCLFFCNTNICLFKSQYLFNFEGGISLFKPQLIFIQQMFKMLKFALLNTRMPSYVRERRFPDSKFCGTAE